MTIRLDSLEVALPLLLPSCVLNPNCDVGRSDGSEIRNLVTSSTLVHTAWVVINSVSGILLARSDTSHWCAASRVLSEWRRPFLYDVARRHPCITATPIALW